MPNHIQRRAIKGSPRNCMEMHCTAAHRTHKYGSRGCSWVELEGGEIMSRREANATSSRPDLTLKP